MHHTAELGQMRSAALPMKQSAAQLLLKQLDCARQRRLRYVAFFRCAREIEFLCHGEEITNLMHFHGDPVTAHEPLFNIKSGDLCYRPGMRFAKARAQCRSSMWRRP
jgi:hypothetical protein